MTLSLRSRIVLTLLPLLALLVGLGIASMILLHDLGGRIEAILHDNYTSVLYMERLNEALERIDSSYQFALAGQEKRARQQYQEYWGPYLDNLRREQNNITEPGEDQLVAQLTELTERYRQQGDTFYGRPAGDPVRKQDYFGPGPLPVFGASTVGLLGSPLGQGPLLAASALLPGRTGPGGLLDQFKEIKDVAGKILRLNQESMEQASRNAQETARTSLIGFGLGLIVAVLVASGLAWHTIRALLRPIRLVTESAQAIGLGNLDQVVPVMSGDELGRLAETFNTMARQLRQYRQTGYARLLRAQRTSQATIDSFPDPVLVVDEEGQVEMANPAAQGVLGVTGRRDSQQAVVPWQAPEPLRERLREAIQRQQPYLPEGFDRAVLLRRDGGDHFFLPRILPIRDPYGNSLGAAVLLEDVTRFRLLDEVKSHLVATVSHELKTPLTGIRLAVHLLLEEAVGPLTPKQTELLLDARDNGERLLAMVNNLLDLTRLEEGREHLALRPENPAELLQAAAEAVRPRAADKGVAVVVEAPPDLPPVAAESQRLGHALGNLLDNALAYTDRGGQITLAAAAADDGVTLTIADTGRGIPPQHLPQVFTKFFRVPGQSPESGTGLGLAIVREIVAAHGGSIRCESQPGVGTTFRIQLPIWKQ